MKRRYGIAVAGMLAVVLMAAMPLRADENTSSKKDKSKCEMCKMHDGGRGARLYGVGSVGDHPVRGRGPAGEARHRTLPPGTGTDVFIFWMSRPRVFTWRTLRSSWVCSIVWWRRATRFL